MRLKMNQIIKSKIIYHTLMSLPTLAQAKTHTLTDNTGQDHIVM